ncbi:MAG: ATP-binding cassette domain-containing protein, partial [Actinomycetota bacterium]|nr:ATP-binding cassette domain-containing protein [Actinomycetota bacterium]
MPHLGHRMTLAAAHGLAVGYTGRPVLEGLEFSIEPGQRLAVLGPNGGGKSTLVRALTGELTPLAGRLELAARCSVVPQTERSRLDYPVTALDVAVMGSVSRLPWWRRPGRRERRRALAALAAVNLE